MNANASSTAPWRSRSNSGLSLLFEPGQRPTADNVLRLVELSNEGQPEKSGSKAKAGENQATGFAISHRPDPSAGWLEILAGGLTFDLAGLNPGLSAPLPEMAHWYGFRDKPPDAAEAVTLMPGEQLQGADNLLPVMRVMAATATRLAADRRLLATG